MITERCIWSWTTQTYQLYLSQPTSHDFLTNPVWEMKMYFDHQKLLLAWSKICTKGDKWEQFFSSTNCMSLETMAKLLRYLMDRVWQHAPKTLHIWDELAAKSGLQCISLSSWPFDPKKRVSVQPRQQAYVHCDAFPKFRTKWLWSAPSQSRCWFTYYTDNRSICS